MEIMIFCGIYLVELVCYLIVRTRDRKCAAHFEHTIAVGAGEADILSSFKFIEEVLGDKAI